jgi:hypothetical protein
LAPIPRGVPGEGQDVKTAVSIKRSCLSADFGQDPAGGVYIYILAGRGGSGGEGFCNTP